ncbi:MAG: hypothetical protein ACI8WB_005174, partial [Phenylobacterium sp.]
NKNRVAIQSKDITRTHRERLLKNGFIEEVVKGWYIATRPDEPAGESTAWYTSFWGFCADYLNARFGKHWCLSPEQSVSLHIGNKTVPKQLLVRSPKGNNSIQTFVHNTSMFVLKLALPPAQEMQTKDNLQVISLPAALISCPPGYFIAEPLAMRTALAMIKEPSDLLRLLLEGGQSIVAGRLAGALRNIGRDHLADSILETMRSVGYTVIEKDPFDTQLSLRLSARETSPHVNRMKMNWEKMREPIIKQHHHKSIPDVESIEYLKQIDEIYTTDAYHSLSIEGYQVSEELIERVRSGQWDPHHKTSDFEHRNALAARGYWQAFQAVKQSVEKVLNGQHPATVAKKDHSQWYRELFSPGVVAGLFKPADLAGYRNQPVYIRRSKHVPPSIEAIRDLMPALFELLEQESDPSVRAILGHFFFVNIHPYADGNGRTGRFLMNLMRASHHEPWLVIPVSKRNEYMSTLEIASVEGDIVPFMLFLGAVDHQII